MIGVTLRYKWITKMYTYHQVRLLVGDKNPQSIMFLFIKKVTIKITQPSFFYRSVCSCSINIKIRSKNQFNNIFSYFQNKRLILKADLLLDRWL